MQIMTDERQKKTGRPKKAKPTVPVQVRLPEDLTEALTLFADENRRSRNQEIILAVETYLRAHGRLPGSEDADDKGGEK